MVAGDERRVALLAAAAEAASERFVREARPFVRAFPLRWSATVPPVRKPGPSQ
jgi:hypothetical protein